MPRVERLSWRNSSFKQPMQQIVLRFYGEVLNVAPDFIHRFFVFLNQAFQRQEYFWRRRRMDDCGLSSLSGWRVHRKNIQQRRKQWRERLPDVVGDGVQGNLKDVQAGKCNRPAFEFHDQLHQMAFSLEMQVGEGRYTLFNGRRLVTCSLFPLDALYGGENPERIHRSLN